jgi:uncharacterized protein (DUF2147 family)
MIRKFALAAAAVTLFAAPALADPIEGNWKRPNGTLEIIKACGGSFCVTVGSGEHSGKSAGNFKSTGGNKYKGTLTDISANKTYNGKATLNGNSLVMSGCVFGGLICKSETWTR